MKVFCNTCYADTWLQVAKRLNKNTVFENRTKEKLTSITPVMHLRNELNRPFKLTDFE